MGNELGWSDKKIVWSHVHCQTLINNPHYSMEVSPLTISCTCALLQSESVDPCSIDSIGEPE